MNRIVAERNLFNRKILSREYPFTQKRKISDFEYYPREKIF